MEIDKISRINSILSFKLINLLLFSNGSFWDLRYFSDEFHSHSLHYTLLTRIKCDNKTVFLAVCVLCKYRIIIRTYLSISLPSGNNNLLEVRRIGCLLTTHEEHATYYYQYHPPAASITTQPTIQQKTGRRKTSLLVFCRSVNVSEAFHIERFIGAITKNTLSPPLGVGGIKSENVI